ncbi:MAG: hypothetical protein EXS48_00440 [Candidatus Staskawiczbacteria bacterium]|nr:hypothetical protein [Candidatus Staskawiczbacteria bacterium]
MTIVKRFFDWYNSNYDFHLRLATLLFSLQVVHLVWLTCNVVLFKLFGISVFPPELNWLIAAVDYTEIPALITVSLVYINDIFLGKGTRKACLYLLLLNSQWLHMLWITDEIVLENFTGQALVAIPVWLAWIAISIDYLELPVMYDTILRTLRLKKNNAKEESEFI